MPLPRRELLLAATCVFAVFFAFYLGIPRKMPPKPSLNPASFPRPPLLERTSRHLQVKWNGSLVADTKEGYWVLETYHPPSMSR